jgi:hypothetical protein
VKPTISLLISLVASASLIATTAAADPAAGGTRTFTTTLSGAEEVPGPGDPDGSGTVTVTVDVREKQICYSLEVSGIEDATAAHIHVGADGVAGPVVVPLDPPTTGTSEDCIDDVGTSTIARILARPDQYYVNVHNADFPAGALRGQLA